MVKEKSTLCNRFATMYLAPFLLLYLRRVLSVVLVLCPVYVAVSSSLVGQMQVLPSQPPVQHIWQILPPPVMSACE